MADKNYWPDAFTKAGAVWVHDGKSARPHALLTSGKHSDGFVNCTRITEDPATLNFICGQTHGLATVIDALKRAYNPAWAVGSALGAVTFAYAVAMRAQAGAAFTEKDGDLMKLGRFEIKPGQKVLVVEDVISTGGSTIKTIEGIKAAGVPEEDILPAIVCLVNRSGQKYLAEREIKALLTLNISMWDAEKCPLCQKGSKVVRPKSHWADLIAPY